MIYDDIAISWGGKGGSAASLMGLGRGKEALAAAAAAMTLADQVCIVIHWGTACLGDLIGIHIPLWFKSGIGLMLG